MSDVLYEAGPSMVRTHPLGTLLATFVTVVGAVLAVAPGPLLAMLPIPLQGDGIGWIIGLALVAVGAIRLLSWWVATWLDRLVIKSDEIVWNHGLINKQYTEINMGSVRTVRVNQSILQRIMNAGDVTVFTSGDIPELEVRGLPNPGAIRDLIKPEAG